MPLAIRPAADSDAEAVAHLMTQLGYPQDAAAAGRRLRAMAESPSHAVLLAVDGGEVLGCIHVFGALRLESDFAEIGALVVDEAARGRKTGRLLVDAAVAWAAAAGWPQLRVRCNVVRTDAHRFYETAGFARSKSQHVFTRPL
ncbi:MAG TPA: GNAT family N-acetyltransferase [Thermoanaerobaculia bacterium]|jgi:GNAT superfamily N-acetyltransferase